MALTTFTPGQVLTAAQLNAVQANDYNQTVSTKTASYTLVAADKGTRVVMNVATANTVTVNTSLFSAGDTLVIQNIGAGTTTVTAGTATVSSAGPLAIPTNGSGTLYFTSAGVSIFFPSAGPAASSALTLVSTTTLSTASTTFTNAFSATYKNYLILMNQLKFATSSGGLYLTLGSASSSYSYTQMYAVTSTAFVFGQGSSVNAYMYLADMDATNGVSQVMNILSPFETDRTTIVSEGSNYSGSPQWSKFAGLHTGATSFTSFTLASSTGTNLSGTVEVYGYGL
jgi:hypothetical protein